MKEETNWLMQSKIDFNTAKNSFNSKDYYASAFWCQQSIEKAIKALLIKEKKKLIKIHDLVILSRMGNLPEELLKKVKLLSGIYTESRYGIIGNDIPANKFKEKDVLEFINITGEVLKWVEKKI